MISKTILNNVEIKKTIEKIKAANTMKLVYQCSTSLLKTTNKKKYFFRP